MQYEEGEQPELAGRKVDVAIQPKNKRRINAGKQRK
jgi:hypothetical protein